MSRAHGATIATLLVGLVATIAAAATVQDSRADARDRVFRDRADRLRLLIESRVDGASENVISLRNSLQLTWPADEAAFRALVQADREDGIFDEARAVEFVRRVDAADLDRYEAGVTTPGFDVHPRPPVADELFVVEYVEPLAGNEAALGFDLGSQPDRRAAVEEARDTGRAVATTPIGLVQDPADDRRAFLLMAPLYDDGRVPATGPARRRHFVGLTLSVFDAADVLDPVRDREPDLDFELFDVGATVDEPADALPDSALVFDSDGERHAATARGGAGLHAVRDLDVGGRRWRLVATPGPTFAAAGPLGLLTLLAGLLLSGLLAALVGSVTNARRRAEALAEDRTAELQTVIRRAPDATVVVDADGRIVLASEQVRPLLGHEPDALVGRPIEDLLPERLRAGHVAHRDGFLHRPVAREMGAGLELVARRADGTEVDVEVSLNPLPPGSLGVVTAALRDVSVRRQATRALEEGNRRLKEADESKSAFFSNVSHELKNPLAAIQGFASLLKHPDLPEDDRRSMLERIERNTADLSGLIDEVLAFSRLERGHLDGTPQALDLAQQTRATIDRLGAALATHQVRVVADEPVEAWAAPETVTRIVGNLVVNAVRYTPADSTITVSVAEAGGRARLLVDDEGAGIAPGDRERVFQRFWRGPTSGQVGGTGLGLAIVKEFSEAAGGSVTIEESPAGGARFVVDLPRHPRVASDLADVADAADEPDVRIGEP